MAAPLSPSRPGSPSPGRFLSGGFRPFFLGGAIAAALMIALWVPWFLGFIHVPTALGPVVWHQHELLFGYVPAIIAGFLLTAVPNWTGRKPLTGLPLLALFLLWIAGRIAVSISETTGLLTATLVTLAFLPVLGIHVSRELLAANNRRNYKIVAVLTVLFAAQLLFHWEFARYGRVEIAGRLAIGAIVLLIAIVGGRIIPTFTANWLRKHNPGREPAPFGAFDIVAMAVSVAALAAWPVTALSSGLEPAAGLLMLLAGFFQLTRQLRWCPERTWKEPLVTILHIAFLFVPLGFLLLGAALLDGNSGLHSAGLHAWTSGATGAMTLAVMTRATRGHTNQALRAPLSTVLLIYLPVVIAAFARIIVAIRPDYTMLLLPLAGVMWMLAFLGYAGLYGSLVLRHA